MLTQKELLILSHLRSDSRIKITTIAEKIGMAKSTVFDNLVKLNKKIVKKNVSLLDFSKMGYGLRVNFAVKVKDKKGLKQFLLQNNNINSLYKTTNNFDFYIEAIFKNMKDLDDFKDKLWQYPIEGLDQHFIIEDVKREKMFEQWPI